MVIQLKDDESGAHALELPSPHTRGHVVSVFSRLLAAEVVREAGPHHVALGGLLGFLPLLLHMRARAGFLGFSPPLFHRRVIKGSTRLQRRRCGQRNVPRMLHHYHCEVLLVKGDRGDNLVRAATAQRLALPAGEARSLQQSGQRLALLLHVAQELCADDGQATLERDLQPLHQSADILHDILIGVPLLGIVVLTTS